MDDPGVRSRPVHLCTCVPKDMVPLPVKIAFALLIDIESLNGYYTLYIFPSHVVFVGDSTQINGRIIKTVTTLPGSEASEMWEFMQISFNFSETNVGVLKKLTKA